MAEEFDKDRIKTVILSRKEVSDLIGLSAAQLADEPLIGNQAGACPTINIVEHGLIKYKMVFILIE